MSGTGSRGQDEAGPLTPAAARRCRSAWIVLAFAVGAYLTSLGNGFAYDDVPIVLTNPTLDPAQPWWRAWTEPYWPGTNAGEELDVLYRPLAVQTYAWERRAFGTAPAPFHITNVMLHVLACLGVLAVARRLNFGDPGSLAAAAWFAVHPIHVEAVANVIGRAEILSLIGVIVAILGEHRRANAAARIPADARQAWIGAAMLALGTAIALFSKESGVAVLVVVPALRLWWNRRLAQSPDARPGVTWRRGLVSAAALTAVVFVVYLAARYEACAGRLSIGGSRFGPGNVLREADSAARLWTPVAVLGRYAILTAYPARLLSDYSVNAFVPVRSPLEGDAPAGLLAAAGLLLVALHAARRGGIGGVLVIGFAASYALASQTFLLIDVLVAERLFYAPSMWVALMIGAAWASLQRTVEQGPPEVFRSRMRRITALGCALLAALAVRTAVRNPVWRDTRTLATRDLAQLPEGRRSVHLCYLVGEILTREGDVAAAEALLTEAVRGFPDYPDYLLKLGELYLAGGRATAAIAPLQRAYELAPRRPDLAVRLQQAKDAAAGVDPQSLLASARRDAKATPDDASAVRRWAVAAERANLEEAVAAYRRLLELTPDDPAAVNDLAQVCVATGRRAEALRLLDDAVQRFPADAATHCNLALLLMDRTDREHHDPARAERLSRRAVELEPTRWDLRVNLAEVLAAVGKVLEAADLFDELAAQSDPGSPQERQYRARAAELRR